MEFTSKVMYKGHLAFYNVLTYDSVCFKARLLEFEGLPQVQPPKEIALIKTSNGWTGNTSQDLVYCMGFSIDIKLKSQKGKATKPVLDSMTF